MPYSLYYLLALTVIFSCTPVRGQECPEIQENQLGDLIADAVTEGDSGRAPAIVVLDSQTVCLAVGFTRDRYRYASVVVSFNCSGSLPHGSPLGVATCNGELTVQFDFECVDGPQWQRALSLVNGNVFNPADANLTTPLRTNCAFCFDPTEQIGLTVDMTTHCSDCADTCTGLMRCTSVFSSNCCNYYENDTCTLMCTSPLVPDGSNNCNPPCPTLSDPLNGTVTLTGNTTDHAATYSCNDGYSLVGGSSRVCQANGTWSGNEPMCQLCPMDHYVLATDLTCLPCPDNSGSLEGTVNITGCVCFQGYTGNNGGPCNLCPMDHYVLATDLTCLPCPDNSGSLEGTVNITGCVCFRGYTGNNGGPCDPCPMGTFKPLVGDVPCINCATLLTTSGTGAVECDACRYSSGDPLAGQECYAFDTTIQFSSNTVTDTRIRLFWTPTSTVSSKSGDEVGMVVAYRIWCSATGGSIPDHLLSIDIPPTVSTILFDGLQPLVEYTFNITIIARISNVEEAGPPGPPLMITTLPSPNQPDVSSSIPTSTPSLLPSATVQSIEQPNATPTPTTAAVLLAAPETVTAVVLSGTEVTVTWSGVDGASGYEILVTSTHGSDTITVIGGLVLTKAIVNLIPYTNYTITVAGVPEEGNTGTPSEPVYVTTNEELPSPPTNVHVFEEDGSLINVTWSPPEFPNGVITGYKVKITLESGAIMTYTVDPQLSVILPKPSGAYSVSIIAINGIGTSEAEEATIVEQPTVETGATTSSSTDLSTAIVASIVVGGLLFILMLSCLCCVISCFLYYKRKKMGEVSFARENSYIYAQGEPDISGLVPLGHPEDQLTAKRWMRMNVNYSSASALLPPMSVNMVETNIDAVDGMYAEVNEMQRMRDGEPGERPPSYLEVVRDAQPCDYGNEELYLSMEKFYYVDVDKTNSLAPYELDDSRLEILEDEPLGEGEFGRVVKGVAKGVVPGQPKSAVAIKMLKEGASDSARKDFLGEAHMLAQFQHPNVMTLLGVVTNKKPSLVITHFMPNGSLKTFLKGQKKKLSKVSLESPRNFRVPDQLEIAEQIASGMEYLASKFFIHRDLAARNVLVGEKNHVKISDFGLSRALARDDTYYYLRESKKLPVKWMALESLEYRKFSTYSDIWSFGVVFWEIFSYGAGPYKGIAPTEVINHLRAGNRLECPEECPQEVYDLMKLCWEEKKEQRPTFSQVKMRLKAIGIASRRKESKNETETSKDNAEDEIYINDDMGP